ncbi:MAG: hypothetical protein KJ985_05090, partial [Proteobacteria bacterium]|nr:hypothetical protein [Pseudomonadota bacterium]
MISSAEMPRKKIKDKNTIPSMMTCIKPFLDGGQGLDDKEKAHAAEFGNRMADIQPFGKQIDR